MAENNNDIWSALNQTYIKSASVERKEQQDTITNGYKTIYKNDLDIIQRFADKQKSKFKEIADEEAKLHQLSLQYKRDIFKQESQHYDNIYNLKTGMYKREVSFLERERDIREKIAKDGKTTLGDLAELYTLEKEREKERKKSIEAQQEQFKKRVDTVKQAFKTITDHILKFFNEWDNLLRWNQWETGIKNLGSAYEERFTEIAARNGSDTQMETHSMIKNALATVINDSILVKGLNFNTEVFPAITEAVQKGFMGQEATDIAINNAIDKKITPWLDTSSETWVNLQYQLSDDMLAQLKGQQMLLQETREGNRILQNGVVTALMDELAPTLLNIDANTTNVTDLSGQAQQMVASLMANGYSKQDAVKVANQTIDAYQNPFQNLSGNSSTWQKLLAIGGLNGGDLASAMDFATGAISPFNNGTWQAGGAVAANLGVPTNGFTRNTNYIEDLIGAADAALKYSGGNLSGTYNNAVTNLNEFTTATQQNDNEKQNTAADYVFDKNLIAHGIDIAALQLNELKELKTWIITGLGALLIGKFTDKLTDGFIKKFLTKSKSSFSGIGQGAAGADAGNVGSWLGKGALSKGAGTAAKVTGGAAAALGTGVAIAGFKDMYAEMDFAKNENNLTIDREEAKKDATTSAVAGGLGAVGAAVGLFASGPIGLAIAAVGGLVLGVKKYNDYLEKVRDATGLLTQGFTEAKQKINEEHEARDKQLRTIRSNVHQIDDANEKLEYLKSQGLDPNISASKLNASTLDEVNKELDIYLNNLITENKKDNKEDQKNIDAIGGNIKTQYNKDVKELKDQIYGQLKGKSKDEQYEMLSALGYTDEELDALFRNKLNGAASDGELWRFLDKGGKFANKKGIESFANKIGSGKILADDVNAFSNVYINSNSYTAPTLFDQTKMTGEEISKIYTAAEYLYDYKEYGRKENPITNNVPNEFKQKSYDEFKDYLTGLSRDYNTVVNETFKQLGYSKDITPDTLKDNKEFRLGSSYIPYDMIAKLHTGERVLTEGQNKQYTEELVSGNSTSSIIQAGVQDIVIAIKSQTSEIINYLSTMSFSNSSFGNSQLNMLPSMGNTKVTI